ncbi:MAG: phosphoribosyl-AMP cyclohydrolase [Planctomycetes bacterium]|nr:phosphoribosyl-AMP cyclohydrolase [Planctomycetota bacterium]
MTARLFPEWPSPRVFPAIDLRGGHCVRLVRGARDAEIRYGDDPVEAARRWAAEGAECLHVIDLGGAFGEPHSRGAILAIARVVDLPVQAGGGVRDEATLAELLEGGVARAILGTRAFRDPEFLERAVLRHGAPRIVLALDTDGERIKVSGWEESSSLGIEAGLELAARSGVEHLLVTATDRDGTLEGPRLELLERVLASARAKVVAAGGIGTLEHVRQVLALASSRLEGVVVGRALYEGTVSLPEAVALARDLGRREGAMQSDSQGGSEKTAGLDAILDAVKYDASGLVPAVVQDAKDGQVLMVAYMNRESLRRTLEGGVTCFWSRSRKEFWVKGATSGNTQKVVRVALDCDRDCVLVVVEQKGVACHTGSRSCFFSEVVAGEDALRQLSTDGPIYRKG